MCTAANHNTSPLLQVHSPVRESTRHCAFWQQSHSNTALDRSTGCIRTLVLLLVAGLVTHPAATWPAEAIGGTAVDAVARADAESVHMDTPCGATWHAQVHTKHLANMLTLKLQNTNALSPVIMRWVCMIHSCYGSCGAIHYPLWLLGAILRAMQCAACDCLPSTFSMPCNECAAICL